MRKVAIIPVLFILTVISTMAAPEFYLEQEAIKENIFISEVAEFEITLTNLLDRQDVFILSVQDPAWIVLTPQVLVNSGQTKTFTLRLDPVSDIRVQPHAVSVKFKSSQTSEIINELFIVNVRPYDPIFGVYRPSVQFGATIDKEVDPRKKVPVEIYMRNRNALDIGVLRLLIDGELFYTNVRETLGPLEEKRTEYLFDISPLQDPGLYTLNVEVQVQNVTISKSTQTYEVMSYSTITQDSSEKRFLFKNTETIQLENLGNSPTTKQVNLAMPFTKRLFTSSTPEATTVRESGGTTLQWNVNIPAQSVSEIVVVTNYRIPIFIILLIILVIYLYFRLRSPVVVTKEALVGTVADDGVEHLKIRLFVKNRTRTPVEKVLVYDRIPGIAEYIKKKVLGTIQPEKVTKQDKKGTMVKWNLETLEAFEERIITYDIKSKLKIIGNLSLPSSRITFLHRNKERRIYSQRVIVTN